MVASFTAFINSSSNNNNNIDADDDGGHDDDEKEDGDLIPGSIGTYHAIWYIYNLF